MYWTHLATEVISMETEYTHSVSITPAYLSELSRLHRNTCMSQMFWKHFHLSSQVTQSVLRLFCLNMSFCRVLWSFFETKLAYLAYNFFLMMNVMEIHKIETFCTVFAVTCWFKVFCRQYFCFYLQVINMKTEVSKNCSWLRKTHTWALCDHNYVRLPGVVLI